MSHRTCARLFVERFLADLGAEASNEFKDDLENAVEDLLEEEIANALEEAENKSKVMVWKKPSKSTPPPNTEVTFTIRQREDGVTNDGRPPH